MDEQTKTDQLNKAHAGPDLIGICQHLYVRGLYLAEKLALLALFLFGLFLIISGFSRFSFAQDNTTLPIDPAQAAAAINALADGDPEQLGNVIKGLAAEEKAADTERDAGLFGLGPEQSVDYREIKCGTGLLFQLLNGSFGALMLIGATISALFAAWIQRYAVAFSMLIFIAGSLILQSATEIFFFTDYSTVPNLIPTDAKCY